MGTGHKRDKYVCLARGRCPVSVQVQRELRRTWCSEHIGADVELAIKGMRLRIHSQNAANQVMLICSSPAKCLIREATLSPTSCAHEYVHILVTHTHVDRRHLVSVNHGTVIVNEDLCRSITSPKWSWASTFVCAVLCLKGPHQSAASMWTFQIWKPGY